MTQPTTIPLQPEPVISFPSILSRVREAYPELPVDPVILQSILLCLIAGRFNQSHGEGCETHRGKNLLLRTRKEDVGMVLNITTMILNTVFGFSTAKTKIKPKEIPKRRSQPREEQPQHPEEFLRSLFFRARRGPRHSYSTDKDVRDSPSKRHSRHAPRRSSTFPSNPGSPEIIAPTPVVAGPSSLIREATDESAEAASMVSSRRPLISPSSTVKSRPGAPRMQTEPLFTLFSPPPLNKAHSPSLSQISNATHTQGTIPKAVVVSGLENTELPAQRALNRALGDRKLVLAGIGDNEGGTWIFSDDFIFVYVCELEPSDRPDVLRPLIDKFAMSVDINVSPTTRQLLGAHRSSHSSTPLSASFVGSPRSPFVSLTPHAPSPEPPPRFFRSPSLGFSNSSGSAGHPAITASDLMELRRLASPIYIPPRTASEEEVSLKAYTSIHPSLQLYLSDLFSATRHHPELDGTLLSLQAHRDAEDLVRAYRVISGSSLGTDIITALVASPQTMQLDEDGDEETDDGESKFEVDSLGWTRSEDGGRITMAFEGADGVAVRVQAPDTPMTGTPYLGNVELDAQGRSQSGGPPQPPNIWDVSEVDIARVFPRIVSHRLSVRSGPDDEILGSIMFPAARKQSDIGSGDFFGGGDDDSTTIHVRKTVKEILVAILADV